MLDQGYGMERRYLAVEEALEWDLRKVVVEFVPSVDHLKEFEHRGHFRSPIPIFLEVKESFHRV